MTTTLRKTFSHKKARAIRSGFLELINTLLLTPQQGLATSFMLVAKNHTEDNSITVCEIAPVQVDKSTSVFFLMLSKVGGM